MSVMTSVKTEAQSANLRRHSCDMAEMIRHAFKRSKTQSVVSAPLLLAGVPIERVSILLGHQSVCITEKHYAPWVRARQEQLEANVRRTWQTHEPQRGVHSGYTENGAPVIHLKSRTKMVEAGGVGIFMDTENTQLIDFSRRQKRRTRQNCG